MNNLPNRSFILSTKKRALLKRVLQEEGLASSPMPKISRSQEVSFYPLSFAQERLWFLEELAPGITVHNIHRAFGLKGLLNVAALEKSCNEIVKRHEILRTTFTRGIEQPTQVIAPEWTLTIPLIDLRDSETKGVATQEVQQPFDLTQLPLWRVKLLRLTEEEYVLLLTIHHLICDGWSFDVFCQELTVLYKAFSIGKPSPLPELPIQYADFALWQREWLQGVGANSPPLQTQMTYWLQQLGGSVPMLKLPTDRPQLSQTYLGVRQSLVLSQPLTNALKSLSLQSGVTLFMTLLAAFKTLLFQYTQQSDIIICSPIAGRNRVETKELIGCFNNLLPIRTYLDGNLSFQDLMARVRQVTLGAYENQDVPFQHLAVSPNLVSTPLSRAMFVLQNTPNHLLDLPGITVSPIQLHNGMANFDFSLFMEEKGSELVAEVEYKTALFNSTTITQILNHFQILLSSIVANPQVSLCSLPLPPTLNSEIDLDTLPDPASTELTFRDELELQLTKIWEKVLGKNPIDIRDNFFELGGHSLLAVQLFAEMEKIVGLNLPLATLLIAPTIEQLASILRQEGWSGHWTSLVPIQPGGSKQPFFCIHGAGGHVLNYYSLARHLGPDQPFYGLQAQGIDGKHPIHTTIEEMAAHYIQEIRTVQPNGPYFLGGYCMGGTIALEMAQQLHAQGQQVGVVALCYTFNFSSVPLSWLFPSLPKFIWSQFQCLWHNLSLLPHQDKLTFVWERAKTVQRRLISRIVAIRAMSSLGSLRYLQEKAAISYLPQIYQGRVTLFRPRVFNRDEPPEVSWDGLFAGEFEVNELPVYPGAMLLEPFVSNLAEQLRNCLEQSGQEI